MPYPRHFHVVFDVASCLLNPSNVLESQELSSLLSVVRFEISNTLKQRLPHHPVKRRAETQPFVAFTWVIPTHKLDANARDITDKTFKSEEFWYCGYKMSLAITDIAIVGNMSGNYSAFMVKFSLEICNLTQESEVSIQWQPTRRCFLSIPKIIIIIKVVQHWLSSDVCYKNRMVCND